MKIAPVVWLLRIALAAGFLSAVADRFGLWPEAVSVWGTWAGFVEYTQVINPWLPAAMIPAVATVATALEIVLAVGLLVGVRLPLIATASGVLLLLFGFAMALSAGVKAPLDYSVFAAAGGAFALAILTSDRNAT